MRKKLAILICVLILLVCVAAEISSAAVGKPNPRMKRVVEKQPTYRVPREAVRSNLRPRASATATEDEPEATPGASATPTTVTRTPSDADLSETGTAPTPTTSEPEPVKKGMKASTILYILVGLLVLIGGGYSGIMFMKKAREHKERDF